MCFVDGQRTIAPRDVLLGESGGCCFYIDRRPFEVVRHTQLVLDVAPGAPEGFSVPASDDAHFVIRSRLFTDDEERALVPEEATRGRAVRIGTDPPGPEPQPAGSTSTGRQFSSIPSEPGAENVTVPRLIHSLCTRGANGSVIRHQPDARAVSTSMARAALAFAAGVASALVVIAGSPVGAGASGIVPPSKPSVSIPPQVMPDCTFSTVDDTSAGCVDSVLHNINYARTFEGLGPLVLPSNYASDSVPVQQLVITDEERGDRGLSEYSGLDATLNTAALTGALANTDPVLPAGFQGPGGSIFAKDYTPLGADYAWMYDDGYGGTNLNCTSPSDSGCWGHRDNILGSVTAIGTQTPMMGDANPPAGQYAEIFATQVDPADSLVDTITPGALPTPSAASAPDVVQELPTSSPSTGAGTPVTIEGNYFGTSPQVSFGGVPAPNVQVNWDGELTADAPADPAGSATDQVVVTVTTGAGASTSRRASGINEFTYAPTGAPTVTSVSPTTGSQIPSGSVTIHGSNFYDGGVTPIVDFGTVASIGSISYNSSLITTTIPPSINPGTVNITVTTPAGTSSISAADQYTYTGGRTPATPSITSGDQTTFSAGAAGVFDITTTGTPDARSVTDAPFSGCTPSPLPASITLQYAGGTIAVLEGTPQAGDGGTYTVCLNASNGVTPTATQVFTLTVNAPATSIPPPPPPPAPSHGYWLVGSDGGIFNFGSAPFHGSTGSLHLQRPVVGITPTADRDGYWLVASDGGIFAFGDAGFHGSIPGSGLNPAGSGMPHSLNAPIVGMVPSTDGGGYFMVASDGGVFAFGDARFEGSCPGIGGCRGAAVAVVPDASGNGYWVVTSTGSVYPFGDAVNYGAPGPQSSAITAAVATPNGGGYWILDGAGQVFPFGDAAGMGSLPPGSAGGLNPTSAIFATSDGGGYWVVTALGKVSNFGDAPNDGDMSGTHLNGPIIAASGS